VVPAHVASPALSPAAVDWIVTHGNPGWTKMFHPQNQWVRKFELVLVQRAGFFALPEKQAKVDLERSQGLPGHPLAFSDFNVARLGSHQRSKRAVIQSQAS
jgi:hypothetical protein